MFPRQPAKKQGCSLPFCAGEGFGTISFVVLYRWRIEVAGRIGDRNKLSHVRSLPKRFIGPGRSGLEDQEVEGFADRQLEWKLARNLLACLNPSWAQRTILRHTLPNKRVRNGS